MAPKTLANVVKPLLEDAGIQFDIQGLRSLIQMNTALTALLHVS